jgi:hypothetical protein
MDASLYETYEVTVQNMKNKTVFKKKTVEYQHLIFQPGSQRRVHCHTIKPEPNQRVSINQVPLLATQVWRVWIGFI